MRRALRTCSSALLLLAGMPDGAAAVEVYTCRDAAGNLRMQDTPCPQGTVKGSVKIMKDPPPAPKAAPPASRSVVQDQPFVDPNWDEGILGTMLLRARLSKVMASLHNLRMLSMMHFAEHGAYARGPEDLHLDPTTMSTDEIAAVRFGADGTIVAELRESFGAGKQVVLTPKEVLGGAEVTWVCSANFPESVFNGLGAPQCASRAIHGASPPASPQ